MKLRRTALSLPIYVTEIAGHMVQFVFAGAAAVAVAIDDVPAGQHPKAGEISEALQAANPPRGD